jgi:GT2 family glycosyltransferase
LDSIFSSDYPASRMEVIVADGMSQDGSRLLLAARDVRVIDNPARITPVALNLAIEAASGEYILRVDAHSTIAPGYVSTLIDFLASHPDAWGAGGRMFTEPESSGAFAQPISIVLSHRFGVGNSRFRTGIAEAQPADTAFNCCWRRDVFHRVGLFHEQLVRSQDIEMSSRIARAGGTLWLVPQAETTYFARTRFFSYLRHNWSNGVWSLVPAIYLGRLPVSWRHLVPMVFVVALLASLAAGVPWIVALPYALANLLASAHAAWQNRRPQLALLLPISFAGLHLAYGAGSLWGALRVAASYFHRPLVTPKRTLSTT